MSRRNGWYYQQQEEHSGSHMLSSSSSQRRLLQQEEEEEAATTNPRNLVRAACKRRRQMMMQQQGGNGSNLHQQKLPTIGALLLVAVSGFSLYISASVVSTTNSIDVTTEDMSSILLGASSSSAAAAAAAARRGDGAGVSGWSNHHEEVEGGARQLRSGGGGGGDVDNPGRPTASSSTIKNEKKEEDQSLAYGESENRPAGLRSSSSSSTTTTPHSSLTRPAIAWLVSFPNSGTTYTIANAEHVTDHTTATNYAAECVGNVLEPLYPELSSVRTYEDAPFVMSPHLAKPTKYVLTKTHCTGYSDDRPWTFDLHDASSFEEFCRFGFVPPRALDDKYENETTSGGCATHDDNNLDVDPSLRHRRDPKFYTSIDNVHKLVHLIRSPFDNIVARMHLGVSERRKQSVHLRDDRFLSVMNDTSDGLKNWCQYVDRQFHKMYDNTTEDATVSRAVELRDATLPPALLQRMKRVPCHAEFFRYTQFHNLVTEMAVDKALLRLVSPPHVMYYEDYSTDLEATTAKLVEYLDQKMLRPAYPFLSGKTYGHLWSKDEQREVASLVRDLATPETWKLLRRYFPWWKQERSKATMNSAQEQVAIEEYHYAVSPPPPTTQMVWLLAYPATGPMFMLSNLVTASNLQILAATHSRPESKLVVASAATQPDSGKLTRKWKRVWPGHPKQSPFFFRTDAVAAVLAQNRSGSSASVEGEERPQLVAVTKNQCDRWTCPGCPIPEDAATFERSCRIVPPPSPDMTAVPIDLSRVREMMVLVRDPFDVVRSRANRGLKQLAIEAEATNVTLTLPTNQSVVVTRERFVEVRDSRGALEMWCQKVDAQFLSVIANSEVPQSASQRNPTTWWDRALKTYNSMKQVVTCPSRLLSSHEGRYSRLKQFKAIPETQYTEFPVDHHTLEGYRTLPCYSEWLRMVQWYNHVMEFSRPRRTLPRRILRFEDYSGNESDVRSRFDELAESLLGQPLQIKVPERHFNDSRTRHAMLYTPEEARMASALVRTFGSPHVWQLFEPYFASTDSGWGWW